jgi:hypothetical protein
MRNRTSWRRWLTCVVAAGLASVAIPVLARTFAADRAAPAAPSDRTKAVIEGGAERVLAGQTAPGTSAPAGDFVNPKVAPGKVRWHADFAAACRARESGKPVLLFQMMGRLDDQFC